MSTLVRFLRDRSAASAIEYALMAALVSIAVAGAVHALGSNVANLYAGIQNSFP